MCFPEILLGPVCPVNSTLGEHLTDFLRSRRVYSKDSHPQSSSNYCLWLRREGASLMAQQIRSHCAVQWTGVPSLVGELRRLTCHGVTEPIPPLKSLCCTLKYPTGCSKDPTLCNYLLTQPKKKVKKKKRSRAQFLQLCPILWAPTHCCLQAPLSMGFSRQAHWSELPCPPPGNLPDPGIELLFPMSHALADGFFTITGVIWEAKKIKSVLTEKNRGVMRRVSRRSSLSRAVHIDAYYSRAIVQNSFLPSQTLFCFGR